MQASSKMQGNHQQREFKKRKDDKVDRDRSSPSPVITGATVPTSWFWAFENPPGQTLYRPFHRGTHMSVSLQSTWEVDRLSISIVYGVPFTYWLMPG